MNNNKIKLLEQLIDAIIKRDIAKIQKLIKKGVDPNGYLDPAKVRPLHFAAQAGSTKIVKLLLTAGAKINVYTDPDRESPLDIAILHNHKDLIEFLLLRLQKTEEMIAT